MAVTRLGLDGYGVRRAGSFAGKTAEARAITRFGLEGFGVRRYSRFAFANKTADTSVAATGEVLITHFRRRSRR